jgi:hypothetical protein
MDPTRSTEWKKRRSHGFPMGSGSGTQDTVGNVQSSSTLFPAEATGSKGGRVPREQ